MTKTHVTIRKNKTSAAYRTLRRLGIVVSCLGVAVYMCALVVTITHVANKKELALSVRDEATKVAQLEETYYRQVGSFTPQQVADTGYITPANVRYGSLRPQTALVTR